MRTGIKMENKNGSGRSEMTEKSSMNKVLPCQLFCVKLYKLQKKLFWFSNAIKNRTRWLQFPISNFFSPAFHYIKIITDHGETYIFLFIQAEKSGKKQPQIIAIIDNNLLIKKLLPISSDSIDINKKQNPIRKIYSA